ncbi:MAG: hypothetical protein GY765_24165 [bacterium]|nr:hypothetical protein [bacterium]
MKTKKFETHLVLKKLTISNLNTGMMVGIKGGIYVTNGYPTTFVPFDDTCYTQTAASRRCPTDFTCPSGGRSEF